MWEYGRVIVNVAHGDVDERGIDEYAVTRLYRQGDPIVGGVGHVNWTFDGDLAGIRIHSEQPEFIATYQSVRDFGRFVFVTRLHLQLGLELLGTLVHHRAIFVL